MYSKSGEHIEIGGYKALPASPLRPLAAIKAVIKLVENKEDTTQVFKISEALSGNSHNKLFARFVASPYGKRVVEEPIEMENILSDFERQQSFGFYQLLFTGTGDYRGGTKRAFTGMNVRVECKFSCTVRTIQYAGLRRYLAAVL